MTLAHRITGHDVETDAGIFVEIEKGRIAQMGPCDQPDPGYLGLGLVDLQVNGYGGLDLNDGELTAERVEALCGKLAALGVSRFLPTIITASRNRITSAMAMIDKACEAGGLASVMVAGIHVEGPSISPVDGPRGAHPADQIRPPCVKEFADWQSASGSRVRMVTIAPEVDGAFAYIKELRSQGIMVALGHTAASAEQIRQAADCGATLSTHLGNGAAALLPRHPNLLWAQLSDDRLTATLIADGNHLPSDTLKAMVRAKGAEHCVLVSDSVSLADMPPGRYRASIGADVEVGADGRISLSGTPYLAGAGLPITCNVVIAMRSAEIDLATAYAMASTNPRRLLGLPDRLKCGGVADILRFEMPGNEGNRLHVLNHWIAGNEVKA